MNECDAAFSDVDDELWVLVCGWDAEIDVYS